MSSESEMEHGEVMLPALTGTFRTSWRTVLREAAGLGLGVSVVLTAMFLWNGDPLDHLAVVCGVTCAGCLVFFAGRYRLFGVASIEVGEEAVVVTSLGSEAVRIPWAEMREAWYQQKWHFETPERRVRVRDYGFTDDDWSALSFALYALKDAGPVESLPGVLARSPRPEAEGPPETAVFEPQHSSALWWGGPLFGVIAIGTLLASWSSYGDGTWSEDPMITVFCPVASLAFVALFIAILPRLVRRAAFLPESLVLERFVGTPVAMPYEDVLDVHGQNVVTRRGRFVLGDRNSEVFLRLLEPHLQEGQLSGEMALRAGFDMQYLFYGLGAGIVLGFLASFFLPSIFGLSGNWTEVVFFVVFLASLGVTALVARASYHREMKRGLDP